MCDYLWQRMENSRGDLADIVRSGSRTGPPNPTEFDPAPALSPTWLPPPPPPLLPSSEPETLLPCAPGGTQSPSGSFGDPLMELFDVSLALPRPSALIGEPDTMRRPPCSSDDLLKVLQVSPRPARPFPAISGSAVGSIDHGGVQTLSPRTPVGIKRRKSQAKKVVCIPAPMAASSKTSGELVPSDLWAWRKYGQKPIKGSPYPRGYYRCSSSKGCSARKQVERSRTDPDMLVITYTSEHNHPWPTQRNSLAGSTRSHAPKATNASMISAIADSASAPNPAPSLKEEKLSKEDDDEEEDVEEDCDEAAPSRKTVTNDLVSEDDVELFDKIFHQSYKPTVIGGGADEFFADLAELEADPMSLIFSKGAAIAEANPVEEKGVVSSLDSLSMLYWGDRSS